MSADPWQTKFLMKEHVEAYQDMQQPSKAEQPTSEEWILMRDYILLPFMLTMVQRNIDQLQFFKGVLKEPYLAFGEKVASSIQQDMYQLRRRLDQRNIRIETGEQEVAVLHFLYRCRGYSGTFSITREEAKAQMSLKMKSYIRSVFPSNAAYTEQKG